MKVLVFALVVSLLPVTLSAQSDNSLVTGSHTFIGIVGQVYSAQPFTVTYDVGPKLPLGTFPHIGYRAVQQGQVVATFSTYADLPGTTVMPFVPVAAFDPLQGMQYVITLWWQSEGTKKVLYQVLQMLTVDGAPAP